jgi:drug/metabolite transporter (DMT)-like permease
VDARRTGLLLAGGSGILYGAINVLAKPVDVDPLWKAAVAYLVAAAALSPFLRRLRLARGDLAKVLTMGLVGGGLAPVLLFLGLRETAAVDAGLLLTLEMVATAILAAAFLHERFAGRHLLGLAALLAASAAVALAQAGPGGRTTPLGALLVAASALAWGVDNVVSTRLVGAHAAPGLIAAKALLGGLATLAAALLLGSPRPQPAGAGAMAALGVVSIAVSSLLFYAALKRIGAGRTSAMNVATTALVGAFGGALVLGETVTPLHVGAVALVAAGGWLLLPPRGAGPA